MDETTQDFIADLQDEISELKQAMRLLADRTHDGVMALAEAVLDQNYEAAVSTIAYLGSIDDVWAVALQRARKARKEEEK